MTAPDEILVRDVLHRATDDLTAPTPSLTAAATLHGGRLRRRRRALAATGTLCAAALVAVPVGLSLGGSTSAGVATDPTRTPSPSASATPDSGPPPGMVDNDAWATMPAPDMLDVLTRHLSTLGLTTTDELLTDVEDISPGVDSHALSGWMQADLVADRKTVGGANVVLYVTGLAPVQWTCPFTFTVPTTCHEVVDADGHTIGRRAIITDGDVITNEVVLQRKNGGFVYAAASNSDDDKWGAASHVVAPTPPLTLDQLQTIAEDDAWIGYEPPAA